jgi:uncharacterized protein
MHFAREDYQGEDHIRAYERGRITIGDRQYAHSLILCPGQTATAWRPRCADDLLHEDFDALVALQPDVVLLGTGSQLCFPPPGLTVRLLQLGVGVEVMDTAAACRTYNILLAEQRRVVAALLLD